MDFFYTSTGKLTISGNSYSAYSSIVYSYGTGHVTTYGLNASPGGFVIEEDIDLIVAIASFWYNDVNFIPENPVILGGDSLITIHKTDDQKSTGQVWAGYLPSPSTGEISYSFNFVDDNFGEGMMLIFLKFKGIDLTNPIKDSGKNLTNGYVRNLNAAKKHDLLIGGVYDYDPYFPGVEINEQQKLYENRYNYAGLSIASKIGGKNFEVERDEAPLSAVAFVLSSVDEYPLKNLNAEYLLHGDTPEVKTNVKRNANIYQENVYTLYSPDITAIVGDSYEHEAEILNNENYLYGDTPALGFGKRLDSDENLQTSFDVYGDTPTSTPFIELTGESPLYSVFSILNPEVIILGGVQGFPSNQILDNFNRADEGPPPSASWDTARAGGLKVVSNQLAGDTAGNNQHSWGTTFSADCEAYITMIGAASINLSVRLSSAWNGYNLRTSTSLNRIYIERLDLGVPTQLGNFISQTITAGDAYGISAVGNVITAWRKPAGGQWTNLGQRVDSTHTHTGKIAVGFSGTTIRLDDFGGGDYIYTRTYYPTGKNTISGSAETNLVISRTGSGSIELTGKADVIVDEYYYTFEGSITISGNAKTGSGYVGSGGMDISGNAITGIPFITTWQTNATGNYVYTDSNQIKFPIGQGGTYDFIIDWGDGTQDHITSYGQAELIHTYGDSGTYDVTVSGVCYGFGFHGSSEPGDPGGLNGSDSDGSKLTDVKQWGTSTRFHNYGSQFYGCDNIEGFTAENLPDLTGVTTASYMFSDAYRFNGEVGGWDVSSIVDMHSMFKGDTSFDQDISGWNVSNVIEMWNMLLDVTLSTENYDALLNGWSALTLQNDITFHAGNSKYSMTNGSTARTYIINTYNWTIYDGGPVEPDYEYQATGSIELSGKPFYFIINDWTAIPDIVYSSSVIFGDTPTFGFGKRLSSDELQYTAFEIFGDTPTVSTNLKRNADVYLEAAYTLYGPEISASQESYTYTGSGSIELSGEAIVGKTFVTTWQTNATGTYKYTNDNQIKLPLDSGGTYNFIVEWGDNTQDTITSYNQAEATHTYGDSGTYDVTIFGTCEGFGFALNDQDNSKLTDIKQWGSIILHNGGYQFTRCNNLTNISADDVPDLTNVTNISYIFSSSSIVSGIENWNVSTVTSMQGMFQDTSYNQDISSWEMGSVENTSAMFGNNSSFNQDISSWNVSSVTTMSYMFYNATAFEQNIGSWDVSSVTAMVEMFYGVTLSLENYNALLNGWSALTLQNNVNFHAGSSQYTNAALLAREHIVDTYSWIITDGGLYIVPRETLGAEHDLFGEVIGIDTYLFPDEIYIITELYNPTVDVLPGQFIYSASGGVEISGVAETTPPGLTIVGKLGAENHLFGDATIEFDTELEASIYLEPVFELYEANVLLPTGIAEVDKLDAENYLFGDTPGISLGKRIDAGFVLESVTELYGPDVIIPPGGKEIDETLGAESSLYGELTRIHPTLSPDFILETTTELYNPDITAIVIPEDYYYTSSGSIEVSGSANYKLVWPTTVEAEFYLYGEALARAHVKRQANFTLETVSELYGPDIILLTRDHYYSASGSIELSGNAETLPHGAIREKPGRVDGEHRLYGEIVGIDSGHVPLTFNASLKLYNPEVHIFDISGDYYYDASGSIEVSGKSDYRMHWPSTEYAEFYLYGEPEVHIDAITEVGITLESVTELYGPDVIIPPGGKEIDETLGAEHDLFGEVIGIDLYLYPDEIYIIAELYNPTVDILPGQFAYSASGGVEISGSAGCEYVSVSYPYTGTGLLEITGIAQTYKTDDYYYTSTGSIETSGKSQSELAGFFYYTGDGSLEISGISETEIVFSYTSTGSIEIGGSSETGEIRNYVYTGRGFVRITGKPEYIFVDNFYYTTKGRLTLSGTASTETIKHFIASPTGTLEIEGSAETSPEYSYASTGFIEIEGSAETSPEYSYIGTGTLEIEGSAETEEANIYHYTSTGFIEISGKPDYEIEGYHFYDALGTLEIGGSSEASRDFYYDGSVKLEISGTAKAEGDFFHYTSTGTLTVSGEASTLTPFATTWQTNATGTYKETADNQIKLPLASTGTYNFYVDWGDGSAKDHITSWNQSQITHTYGDSGTYQVSIEGTCDGFGFSTTLSSLTGGDRAKLIDVKQWGTVKFHNNGGVFYYCNNLNFSTVKPPDLSSFTNAYLMFSYASIFNSDIGKWNTSNVTNMGWMFWRTTLFNQDIGDWNTENVTDLSNTFNAATSFNQDIGRWNTSKVTGLNQTFYYAIAFNQDLNGWDTSNVTSMTSTFWLASSFNGNISNWNTSKVTSMIQMFWSSSFNQDISGWNVSNVTNMTRTFRNTPFNQNIGNWNVSKVTQMQLTFYGATSFNQNLNNWNVSNVISMTNMFAYASSFNGDVSSWNVSNVTNMEAMFRNTVFDRNISSWNVSKVTNMTNMFNGVTLSTQNYNALLIGWNSLLSLQNNVNFHGGSSKYMSSGQTAKNNIIDTYNWTITDGGLSDIDFDHIVSGRLTVSGESGTEISEVHYIYTSTGKIEIGGVSVATPEISYSSSGLIEISGEAYTYSYVREYAASGTITINGSSLFTPDIHRTTDGTLTLSGSALTKLEISYTSSGKLEISGTEETTIDFYYGSSGSIYATSKALRLIKFYATSSGTLTLEGTAGRDIIISKTGDGSLEVSGVAETKQVFEYQSTGSLEINGIAETELWEAHFINIPSGTIEISGTYTAVVDRIIILIGETLTIKGSARTRIVPKVWRRIDFRRRKDIKEIFNELRDSYNYQRDFFGSKFWDD